MVNEKYVFTMLSFLIIALVSVGCGRNSDKTLPIGTYEAVEHNQPMAPSIVLKEDSECIFNYSVLSSYLPMGTYKIENDDLIMSTEDGEYIYTFNIEDGNPVFNKEKSADIPLIRSLATSEETDTIADGTVFILTD